MAKQSANKRPPVVHHPVVDLEHWCELFPVGWSGGKLSCPIDGGECVSSPAHLAWIEQFRRRAMRDHLLGREIPVDVFLWEAEVGPWPDKPWLTRIGGSPWRCPKKKWPVGKSGCPLDFMAQISFADSRDLIPFELPGEILLIFARYTDNHLYDTDGVVLEWSDRDIGLEDPRSRSWHNSPPDGTTLPFTYNGHLHRTYNYPEAQAVFDGMGLGGSYRIHEVQATLVGTSASIPQFPTFDEGEALVCVLSCVWPWNDWPFTNIDRLPRFRYPNGNVASYYRVFSLGIASDGCLVVYRDKKGRYQAYTTGT